MTRTVRTTLRPDQDIEVDDADYTDLQRQGLLVEADDTPPPAASAAGTRKAAPSATTSKEG
jgi:hypothetical protein